MARITCSTRSRAHQLRVLRRRGCVSSGTVLERLRDTLARLLRRCRREQPVNLLNIDVEGCDLAALRSLDWPPCRPAVILIEDHVLFRSRLDGGERSPIAAFLRRRRYAMVAQCVFSFIYVDRDLFTGSRSTSAFDLGRSDLRALAARVAAPAAGAR